MKKTIIALLALSGVAMADSVISDLTIFNGTQSGAETQLKIGDDVSDVLTMTISGGSSWAVTSDSDNWTNSKALAAMNADLGTTLTMTDINAYAPVGSGQGRSWTDLTLKINTITAGTNVVIYTLGTAAGSTMANFKVTGLDNVTIEYATAGGDGFSITESYTEGALNYTLFKVTGTLTENSIGFSARNSNKNLWGMVAYAPVVAGPTEVIPEPTTATLSLLALAGLAARRRRK